jgi:hypothetical protein
VDTHHPLTTYAALAALGYAAWYLLTCAVWPWGPCRRCRGTGHRYSPLGRKAFRLCPPCDGTGRRVRIGRRIWTYIRNEHQKGTR